MYYISCCAAVTSNLQLLSASHIHLSRCVYTCVERILRFHIRSARDGYDQRRSSKTSVGIGTKTVVWRTRLYLSIQFLVSTSLVETITPLLSCTSTIANEKYTLYSHWTAAQTFHIPRNGRKYGERLFLVELHLTFWCVSKWGSVSEMIDAKLHERWIVMVNPVIKAMRSSSFEKKQLGSVWAGFVV